jgi:GAF domain-containing protein/HAMP domain-containing protein
MAASDPHPSFEVLKEHHQQLAASQVDPAAASTPEQRRNALRIVLVLFIFTTLAALVTLSVALNARSVPLLVVAGLIGSIAAAEMVGLFLILLRRTVAGVLLVIYVAVIATNGIPLVIADLGLAVGVAVAVLLSQLAGLTLSRARAQRAVVVAVAAGVLIVLLDLFGSPERLRVPELTAFITGVVALVILIFTFILLRQFSHLALRTKLVVAFLIVTLLPLVIVVVVNLLVSYEVLVGQATASLSAAASEAASAIDGFIGSNLDAVRVESNLPSFANFLSLSESNRAGSAQEFEARIALRELSRKNRDDLQSYALLDATGQNVLDTDVTGEGRDESGRDYFRVPLEEGRPFVSQIEFVGPNEPALFFSNAVHDPTGNILGVLRVRYQHRAISQLVNEVSQKLGEQSFGVLFDDNYLHLVHGADPSVEFKTTIPLEPGVLETLQTEMRLNPALSPEEFTINLPDLVAKLSNSTREPVFSAQDVVTGERVNQVAVARLSTRPWLMAFFQPQDVFLSVIRQQVRGAVVFALFIAGVVTLVALYLSQVLARPISRLTEVATRVSRGDLSVQAEGGVGDEIGTLATAFNSMTAQIRVLVNSLEAQVEARTAQLRASADVGRAVASILDTQVLLREVVNLITDRFGFYYAAVFTLDERGEYAVLREASGEAGRILKERGHRLKIGGESMVGDAIARRVPRIALDVGEEAVRFANPLLPDTRSEIALPFIVGGQVLGALDVQSTQESVFDEASAAVLQAMADQIAIALNNATLYNESERHILELNALLGLSQELARSRSLESMAQNAAAHIETIFASEDYYLALVDEQRSVIDFVIQKHRNYQEYTPRVERAFGRGRTEYVINSAAALRLDANTAAQRMKELGIESWEEKPGAFLGVPIIINDRVRGVLALQAFEPNYAFSDAQQELASLFATQIAITVENLRLADETRRALSELDAVNRRLTSYSWERYVRMHGGLSGEWRGGRWSDSSEQADDRLVVIDQGLERAQHLTIPLRVRGQTIGEFDLIPAESEREWTTHDLTFAQTLVDQVGQTIENARLLEETERLAGRERVINEINSNVRRNVDMGRILKTAVDELGRSLKAARVFVQLNPPGNGDQQVTDDGQA